MSGQRLFFAIELPAPVKHELARATGCLTEALGNSIRSTTEEKLHLTILFLGSLESEQMAALEAAIKCAAINLSRFRLRLTSLGTFPEHGSPAVLWAGVSECPELLECHRLALELVSAAGVSLVESRQFHPHITLGRRNGRLSKRRVQSALSETTLERLDFEVSRLLLFRSKTDSLGHRYEVVQALDFT